ncbi:hypothetical protein AMS68_002098 [Peltaster fructicola]|uniref:Uncharacterized protein n=1 Tax=Peltaster fructicola TaxID=286661 RepID=A0A6H0XPK3_9PEZI|nr:hypothetical protein AMS68_002098 [Peltaster fructicola]
MIPLLAELNHFSLLQTLLEFQPFKKTKESIRAADEALSVAVTSGCADVIMLLLHHGEVTYYVQDLERDNLVLVPCHTSKRGYSPWITCYGVSDDIRDVLRACAQDRDGPSDTFHRVPVEDFEQRVQSIASTAAQNRRNSRSRMPHIYERNLNRRSPEMSLYNKLSEQVRVLNVRLGNGHTSTSTQT